MDFVSLEPLPGGWSGETFVAHVADGERQVVRIYARDPDRAEVDAALLRLVRGLLPVPEVVEVRRAAGDLPALLITTHLPGERGDLVLPRLGAADQEVLGRKVGELLARLSCMPQPRPGRFVDSDLKVQAWGQPGALTAAVEAAHATGLQHWSAEEQQGLVEVADLAEARLDAVDRTCLVHSDLNPKNLLVDPTTLEITGLVDWEYSHAGMPGTDLGNVLRFDRQQAYVTGVLAACRERLPLAECGPELVDRARSADLWALVDLAARRDANPVAARAHDLLRAIAGARDVHAVPNG